MGVKLEGKPVVQHLRDNLKLRIAALKERGIAPAIRIIRVGERDDDISYERGILKNCEMLGITADIMALRADISLDELVKAMEKSNEDDAIHGIMLFRPLPAHLDADVLGKVINPAKDIDCMSPLNLERVFEGKSKSFAPCTPKAVIELLKFYNIPLKGANVVVAGRSLVVGKPLTMLLLDNDATVTVCHSKTKDMSAVTAKADIVVAAIGKAKFFDDTYFTADSIVIDVGINDAGNGKICGVVDFELVFDKVRAITPAIGGVGAITTNILLSHAVQACETLTNS